jgi:hypothetical protein
MLRVQTELEAEWVPEPGLTLCGRKISLAVPGGPTAHCPGFDLVRRVSVCAWDEGMNTVLVPDVL